MFLCVSRTRKHSHTHLQRDAQQLLVAPLEHLQAARLEHHDGRQVPHAATTAAPTAASTCTDKTTKNKDMCVGMGA
jgi:hypothetical protein